VSLSSYETSSQHVPADLPSTRAPGPYLDSDYTLVLETLGEEKAANVFYKNAIEFYRPKKVG
jgi:hypothetical protein